MSLNKSKGNMYGFVTHTWNPIKGKCIHRCSYCYMTKMYKRYKWDETVRLDEKCLKDNLGKDNFIFVGSSTDMFAENVNNDWIKDVLVHCNEFNNQYLFQSKNPKKFNFFSDRFPKNTILCTTIESTNNYDHIHAPIIRKRIESMMELKRRTEFPLMITIEPVMDFDHIYFFEQLILINPFQINIGADSGHNNLPEPPKEKLVEFITELKKTDIKIHLKDNLKRLL